ncbi:MFS transporter [Paenibacillus donghaensis]|uniref:MFS transporter n=1 Tax=Paenibacillus donghaensis TaxID=414771 RepID=UPI0018836C4E|nr:MFS transporter [Paenibacillus donghaensis]MBE9916901.1 MFS transporter [Paenibacillus donghaensis]
MNKNKENIIVASLLIGGILVPLNSTMIAVALSSMASALNESLWMITWVVTIYFIVMAVLQPIAGKLGDLFGYRRLYLSGVVLFIIGSLGSGMSPNLELLIGSRALQAIGGALLTPNSTALLRLTLSEEKLSKTLGLFGLTSGLGAVLGPLVGGALIGIFDWHAIFLINLPLMVLSLVLSIVFIPKVNQEKLDKPLDFLGSILLAISIASLALLSKSESTGSMTGYAVFFAIALLLFFLREKKAKDPIIKLSLFKNSVFTAANLSVAISNFVMYAILLIIPLLMASQFQISETISGLFLSLFSISLSVSSFIGGRIHQRLGARKLVSYSFIGLVVVNMGFSLGIIISSWPLILIFLIIGGIAIGIAMPSMQMAYLSAVDPNMSGSASGIFSTFRYLGGIASSVLITVMSGFQYLFLLFAAVSLFGIVISRLYNRLEVNAMRHE